MGQGVQDDAPDDDDDPMGQSAHSVDPVVFEYVPAMHDAQDDLPSTLVIVPMGHTVHVDAPDNENEPAGQGLHEEY